MVAILFGGSFLFFGLAFMFLPVLITELSRPRDGVWGAVLVFFGLVLITSLDKLQGTPLLAIVTSSLLIGRLGLEVAQSRWHQLSQDEKLNLTSVSRWSTSFVQLNASVSKLGDNFSHRIKFPQASTKTTKSVKKKWIRLEDPIAVDSLVTDKEQVMKPTLEIEPSEGVSVRFEPESRLDAPEDS